MNENIKSIAIQAGATLQFNRPESVNNQLVLLGNDNLEQFAELIIQECGIILESYDPDFDWATDVLKKHFGVK